jgi:hypothetical protein
MSRSPLTPSDGFSRVANADSGTAATSGATALYQAHADGPAGPHPSGRAARWLGRALRTVGEGPRPFYRAAVVSLGVTSVLAAGAAALIRPPGSLPGTQRHLLAGALAGLGLSAVLGLASLAAAPAPREPASPTTYYCARTSGPPAGPPSRPIRPPSALCSLRTSPGTANRVPVVLPFVDWGGCLAWRTGTIVANTTSRRCARGEWESTAA